MKRKSKSTLETVAIVAAVTVAAFALGRKSGAKAESASLNALLPLSLAAWKQANQGAAKADAVPIPLVWGDLVAPLKGST